MECQFLDWILPSCKTTKYPSGYLGDQPRQTEEESQQNLVVDKQPTLTDNRQQNAKSDDHQHRQSGYAPLGRPDCDLQGQYNSHPGVQFDYSPWGHLGYYPGGQAQLPFLGRIDSDPQDRFENHEQSNVHRQDQSANQPVLFDYCRQGEPEGHQEGMFDYHLQGSNGKPQNVLLERHQHQQSENQQPGRCDHREPNQSDKLSKIYPNYSQQLHPDHLHQCSSTNSPQYSHFEPQSFPTAEAASPIGPNLNSSIGAPPFAANLGGGLYNPANRSPLSDFYPAPSPMVQYNSTLKKTAGRKPKEQSVEMDDDDDDKKQKRRLRNKEAAARCRQRRLDLMGELQGQVTSLKRGNAHRDNQIAEARKQIAMLQEYIQNHDCKLSEEERCRIAACMPIIIPPQQPLMVMPPRVDSAMHSVMSNHSSSSSEQHSPVEDYKPSIDSLKASLPSISKLMPPPALPPTSHPITNNIPISSMPSQIPSRSDNGFLEPELKIPKIEGDRTLSSLANSSFDDVERPTLLGMTSGSQPTNTVITTPSRPFRVGGGEGSQGSSELFPRQGLDFLSSNTGLTPSAQPTMAFVSTPTPMQHHPEADLRPL